MTLTDLNDPRQWLEAMNFLDDAKTTGKTVELRCKRAQRSLQQNAYLHLILRYYASQIGLTETEAEREFKFNCEANREKFLIEVTDRNGNVHTRLRSSSDLSKDEMSSCISNFIAYAEIYAGIIIPYETDYGHLQEARREVENVRQYV